MGGDRKSRFKLSIVELGIGSLVDRHLFRLPPLLDPG